MKINFVAIDYGAVLAGTTAASFCVQGILQTIQTSKGENADIWLQDFVIKGSFSKVYIDAPLSLPGAYVGKGVDFHYREADRTLRAMSPMFLGGLTARAMKLASYLKKYNISCHEVYPAAFVKDNPEIHLLYNKKDRSSVPKTVDMLMKLLPVKLNSSPDNYHQLDSIICWYIGYRHLSGIANVCGDSKEGVILY